MFSSLESPYLVSNLCILDMRQIKKIQDLPNQKGQFHCFNFIISFNGKASNVKRAYLYRFLISIIQFQYYTIF